MKDLLIKIGVALHLVYGKDEAEKLLDSLFKVIFG